MMKHKLWQLSILGSMVFMILGIVGTVLAAPAPPRPDSGQAAPAAPTYTYTHAITVTSTSDEGGNSQRCEQGYTCTLRRAINEVRWNSAAERTTLIAFDLDANDPGYDPTQGVWVIDVDSDNSGSEVFAFRDFGTHGQVIIDGQTQPPGRPLSEGPRIILRGDNKKGVFTLTGGDNIIRGLAFQGFGDWMVSVPGTSNNLIEDNWFGLTITGTDIYLRNQLHPEDGSGQTGINAQTGGYSNTIQSNALVGFLEGAINVESDNSFILSNTVGTLADGTVPEVRADRKCKPNARFYNWFPGGGVDVLGHNNIIENNRIVGMLWSSNDPDNTPDDALEVSGTGHIVRRNIIGLTSDGQPFGVCGDGIHLGGAAGTHHVQVLSNTVVGANGTAGILATAGELGYDLDALTVQGNIIENSAHEAFAFGEKVPTVLRGFNPAAVTAISDVNVSGTAGADSPCDSCIVELFLDRIDMVTETLVSLDKATANASGDWTATLTRALAITEGIRAASTTVQDGQIINDSGTISYSAGTTTRLSELYVQDGAPEPTPPPEPTPEPPIPMPIVAPAPPPTMPTTFNTVITVTTTDDPDDSEQYVCYNAGYPGVVGKTNRLPCTLRQAIEEAESLMAIDIGVRPILIRFDIPTSDDNYNDADGYWIIQLTETTKLNALPTLGSSDVDKAGQVVIAGATQLDHDSLRPDEPRIIIRGPANRSLTGLVVNGEHNVIEELIFQRFNTALQINHSRNTIQRNWFGLSAGGNELYLRNEDAPEDGSGATGVNTAEASNNNLIQNNVFAGLNAKAINLGGGDDNYLRNNLIGTRTDGTIPTVSASRKCRPNARYYNWYGGAGVQSHAPGARNQIVDNIIAGLLFWSDDPESAPDNALDVTGGQDNLIRNNQIGVDINGQEVGTCGRGILVGSEYTRILSNTIVDSGMEAFRSAGSYVNSNSRYFQGNMVKDSANLLVYGNEIPEALSLFTPTRVITIDGLTVSGGDGHPNARCSYCQVELFLDNLDEVTETLQTMAVANTDVNGNWSVALTRELALTEGLRAASTPFNYGIIEKHDAGSASRFSIVYSQSGAILPTPPPEPTPEEPLPIPDPTYAPTPEPPTSYNSVITVTTSDDTATNDTCANTTPDNCSLRRAINQTEALTDAQRPALIAFDIPDTDDGYNPAGYWVISATADLPPIKGGQITINGDSQMNGRSGAPKIILRRNDPGGARLRLGETQFEGSNAINGIAFQGVTVGINSGDNIVQNCWFGLNNAGDDILFVDTINYSTEAMIDGSTAQDNNLIRNNILAGVASESIDLQSNDNLVMNNTIGLAANGTIPVDPAASAKCAPDQLTDNWFGGGGIYIITGDRNRVISNTLAGLLIKGSALQSPPDAIYLSSGKDNLVAYNRIGQDTAGANLWTCGSGIENRAGFTRIFSNTIVNSYKEAIFVNGTAIAINGGQMRGNVISNSVAAIEFGDAVPDALALFNPARVTAISGTQVSGVNGDECPYCWVDLYLDDNDANVEALAYLGSTIADVNGDWALDLPAPLEKGQGLRTISTARDYGVVPNFEAGTSSKLSNLFQEGNDVYLPIVLKQS